MKYVLFYESADNVTAKAPAQFPAHKAWYEDFRARGDLLMLGTFADPQRDGSMAIFTTREAAEEFAQGDPFVVNGVVRNWQVREWNEILERPAVTLCNFRRSHEPSRVTQKGWS